MGTSRGISTPSGGRWASAKREITAHLADPASLPTGSIVADVIAALAGLGLAASASPASTGERRAAGAVGGSTAVPGRLRRVPGGAADNVGGAIAGLGGFATAVRDRGLAEALDRLDLDELDGRPAVEVVARVAERITQGINGVDAEILRTALNDAILEAAQLEEDLGFTDLEAALQAFFNEQGLNGFIELFLTRFVSDLVIAAILEHVDQKTSSEAETEALLNGIEIVCRDKVHTVVEQFRAEGRFTDIDWFGAAGPRLGRQLADSIVTELRTT
jgi:hypothetical protein